MENLVFALDIGTRSVTGIILEKQDETFSVIDYCMVEHKERSMRDGQIHNVVAVSEVIQEVRETLEKTHGHLQKVCVAAAGRALKTIQASASSNLNQQPITEAETIKHLELSAVQSAQATLTEQEKNNYTDYYCVGYSVLQYKLDDSFIGSLIEQSGDVASVDIIATFLPKVVVESLLAALGRVNLEMEALTLEPIAAIHVLIPESMRRLNVALVDIGAGTSDIAITNKGTIVAYGMVPVAGDEITEAISDHYLLDFPKAEQTKRNIVNHGKDEVDDILGFETTISYQTLVDDVTEAIEKLASAIAEQIFQLNAKSPRAVMLIGGGSLTPEITKVLADKLQLPPNRVAIRGIDAIPTLNKTDKLPFGPDFVTPIGIAITAKENPVHYVSITVNKRIIRMFEMKQLTIGDCLIQAGMDINKLYGKPGIASIISFNGKEITLPGGYGEPPGIFLNDNRVSVNTFIDNGDHIRIEKGAEGNEPNVTIEQLIDNIPNKTIFLNDQAHPIANSFYANNQVVTEKYMIQDRDKITVKQPKTIQDFLATISTEKLQSIKPFPIYINNKKTTLNSGETHLYYNGKKALVTEHLKQGDRLTVTTAIDPTVTDMLQQLEKNYWQKIVVTFNKKPVAMHRQLLHVTRSNIEINEDTNLQRNDKIEINTRNPEPFIFQDVFRYIELDVNQIKGHFQLFKNSQPTYFYATIQHGDQLEITWD